MFYRLLVISLGLGAALASSPHATPEPPTIAAATSGTRKIEGFLPLYWDERAGKMWMEINRFDQEFLYITALSAGVGSNELELDRGSTNPPMVVQFERSGPRILLVQSNYRFRATHGDAAERRAVVDSFARSTLWGFDVAAEDGSHVLVDATNFLLRDAALVADELKQHNQGDYHVDPTRSAFYSRFTKAFPGNTEVETTLTFAGEPAGASIREVTPSPEAVTVREHQSFVALPEPGYQPRMQDPRAGYFSTDFMDFSARFDQPVMQRYIARHRLQKREPNAAVSDPVQPITYYVDPGAPAAVRAALLEGASWWNQAFEVAGFRNAFRVSVLPPEADPMDVRYNVIQWIDRSTRGWSYGNSLVDPRTGEIIKGVVSLGSLRQHQDYLIFEGLLAPHVPGEDRSAVLADAVYARLRQLAAHEVGHTLGLQHNYIASTQGRASVMDYPGPRVDIRSDNTLDLSNAYAAGIGEWDKVAIKWGYSQFPAGTNEQHALNLVILQAAKRGLTFITDPDSRPPGSAHPQAHLWDDGPNAVDELNRMMKVRSIALSNFGENNIPLGAPMATLEEVLVPVYFLHRYQTEAASKVLGGSEYTYALRGDGQPITSIVPAAEQRRALKALLATIDPHALALPERILSLIPPRPPGFPRSRETFASRTGVTFDPLAPAEAAADLTVNLILNAQRHARLLINHASNPEYPALAEVLDALLDATWRAPLQTGLAREVQRTVDYVTLVRLLGLAVDDSAPPQVRSSALDTINQLKSYLTGPNAPADLKFGLDWIAKFERDPQSLDLPKTLEAPPGQPIGDDSLGDYEDLWPFVSPARSTHASHLTQAPQ